MVSVNGVLHFSGDGEINYGGFGSQSNNMINGVNGEAHELEGEMMYLEDEDKEVYVIPPRFAKTLPEETVVRENQMLFLEVTCEGYPKPSGK